MDHEGWQEGRLSVAGFVVHDSEFHADLSGLTISSLGGELVRDLSYWLCYLPWFVHLRRMERESGLTLSFISRLLRLRLLTLVRLNHFAALACIRS